MKKLLALVLAMMMVLSLAACGNPGSENTGTPNSDAGTQESAPAGGNESQQPSGGEESQEPSGGDTTGGVDLSAYPSDINEWTAQDLLAYFETSADGLLDGCEDWYQDHETYWAGMPINECAGIWNDDVTVMAMFYTFNPDNPDTTPEEIEEWKQVIREDPNHGYVTEDIFIFSMSHMVGNVMVDYAFTADEDVYNAFDAAWNHLVDALGLTPDF